MKIEWNKVTTYSKIAATIVFITLPFAGFYYGAVYGDRTGFIRCINEVLNMKAKEAENLTVYSDVSRWTEYKNDNPAFSLKFPLDLITEEIHTATKTADWRMMPGKTLGRKIITITIPKAFNPGTNFSDAKFTIGVSDDKAALTSCTNASEGEAISARNIDGTEFTVFKSSDAGAGNFYENTSYRAERNGVCYAIEYTIHSTNISNYPASYKLVNFDRKRITDLLDRIAGSIKFQ